MLIIIRFNFLPVDVVTDLVMSISFDFLTPSGVNSNAHAIISAIGKPIPIKMITVVSNQSGKDNGSSIAVTI